MFKSMDQNEMMTVNGGFYYVPKYTLSGTFMGLEQVANSWGNDGSKCFINFGHGYKKSRYYPWEL